MHELRVRFFSVCAADVDVKEFCVPVISLVTTLLLCRAAAFFVAGIAKSSNTIESLLVFDVCRRLREYWK